MRLCLGISAAAVAASLLASPASAQPAADSVWSVEGRLEDGDRQDPDQSRFDEHPLRLEQGRRYRISAASDDFDTLIRLYRAGENEPVAENDDFEGLNSRVTYVPQESGDYVLRVLSFSPEGRGAYTAAAEALPPLPPPVTEPDSRTSSTGNWALWQRDLAAADPDRDGRHFDDYRVTLRAGETRWISVHSDAFDPVIWILPAAEPEGEPIDIDDDAGPGFNSLLGFRADEDGDYIVRVTSYGEGETGGYWLWISE